MKSKRTHAANAKPELANIVRRFLLAAKSQKTLSDAREAILLGNDYQYRKLLESVVRLALKKLQAKLKCHLVSFHFSSIALRQWLRIAPLNAWQSTGFSGSERDYFSRIYDWDWRSGHIMTDPEMPHVLRAVFGSRKNRAGVGRHGAPHQLHIASKTWEAALELVHSKAFPALVEHELDNSAHAASVKKTLGKLKLDECLTANEFGKFPKDLIKIGNVVRKLWGDPRQRPNAVCAARSFLLSFYNTIGKANYKKDRNKYEQIFTYSTSPMHAHANGVAKEKTGAMAAIFRTKTAKAAITSPDVLKPAVEELSQALIELEHRALFDRVHDRTGSIGEEDMIRRACDVDVAEEGKKVFPYERIGSITLPLHQTIAELLIARRWPGETDDNKRERQKALDRVRVADHSKLVKAVKRELGDKLDEAVADFLSGFKLVGASHVYRQLVRDLAAIAATDDLRETRLLFLDSEPGCGKENLTKLIHLFSPRAHLDIEFAGASSGAENWTRAKRFQADIFKDAAQLRSLLRNHRRKVRINEKETTIAIWEVAEQVYRKKFKQLYPIDRLFNYFTVNMATLHDASCFTASLFGNYTEKRLTNVGRCSLAHALSGTVFFDEFNTLPVREQANCFLRLLDKPYEMDVPNRPGGPIRDVNMLAIFASNKTREALIEAGFNEAVVYRVTKNRIRIPPLRERPLDIAVFVNAMTRKHNERLVQKGAYEQQIHRIDLPAMRLLCELRWPDNYRGVTGLMDDVLGDRVRRGICHKVLTFEDVLQGLRKREAFQAAVSRGQTESVEKSTRH